MAIRIRRGEVMPDITMCSIECAKCGEKAKAEVCNASALSDPIRDDEVREWYRAPLGWFVSDTFPPGDSGVQFLCPNCGCVRRRELY